MLLCRGDGRPPRTAWKALRMKSDQAGFYRREIAPRLVHCGCALRPVAEQRRRIVPHARGVVLEVGIGSGLNLPHYDPRRVERLIGIDPDAVFLDLARPRLSGSAIDVEIARASAEEVPLATASVDTVVATYVLCSIPDLARALRELRRVLRPDGRLLFCEHGRSGDERTARWQDRLTPFWRRLAAGCHLNRDIAQSIAAAGFGIAALENFVLRGTPAVVGFHYLGQASPA